MNSPILAPAAVLVLWSLIVLMWMAVTRFGAIAKSGIDLTKAPPGGRGQDLDKVLPPHVNWKAHNYTHLMEQPTIFYAVVVILALVGFADPCQSQQALANHKGSAHNRTACLDAGGGDQDRPWSSGSTGRELWTT